MMTAGIWVSVYWGGLTVGRLLAGVAVGFVPAHTLIRLCACRNSCWRGAEWLNIASLVSFLGLGFDGVCVSAGLSFSDCDHTRAGWLGAHINGIGFQIAAALLGQSLLPAFWEWWLAVRAGDPRPCSVLLRLLCCYACSELDVCESGD